MNARPESILLVDDDDVFVRALTRHLRALGFHFVYRAGTAAQAVALLDRIQPTLVLSDMVMESHTAGLRVVEAAMQRGLTVAVISGMPTLEPHSLPCRLLRKGQLTGAELSRLVNELLDERRQRNLDSLRAVESVA